MAQTEFAQILAAGEKATIAGPGVVEFKTIAPAMFPTKTVAGTKAIGAGGMAGKGIITTTSAASATAVPTSILSGKVLGFSLASVNPWVLLAVGLAGGYMLSKRRFPKLVW